MSYIPAELKYIDTHQWARIDDDGTALVGITDFAQTALGDVVYVELPDIGAQVTSGEEAGVVESVKSASDVFSPVTGEVVAVNTALEDTPDLVNSDPYGEGWLFRVRLTDTDEVESLLDADAYAEAVEADS